MYSASIGVIAGVLQIFGYYEYWKHVYKGSIKPDTASWSIWTFGALLEAVTYIYVSQDLIKSILPIICTICALAFFIYALVTKHFSKLNTFEIALLVGDIFISIIWYLTSDALLANILLVVTAIISFIPIIIHSYTNPENEDSVPWVIWSIAYFCMCITVMLRWSGWGSIIYPLIFLFLHISIAYLSLDFRKK